MADAKISALGAIDALATGDLVPVVDDPGGAPATKKATVDQIGAFVRAEAATAELIRDTIGASLTAGAGITVTPNDGADTITIAATGGSGGGEPAAITGTPGTGAATPATPAKGFPSIERLRNPSFSCFRYDDGSAWEIGYGYYNGTTITRPAGGFVTSSTGSQLTLSSATTVTVVCDALLCPPADFGAYTSFVRPLNNASTINVLGAAALSEAGTKAGVAFDDTNTMTRQIRVQFTSGTTANSEAGIGGNTVATTRNMGFQWSARFGVSQLPAGPRLLVGLWSTALLLTSDPSGFTNIFAFAKDSADTNIQLMHNDGSGTATKVDTGIALAVNTWYEAVLFCAPGDSVAHALLLDWTNGVVFYSAPSTNLPVASTSLGTSVEGALSATTGTAIIFHFGGLAVRRGY